MATAPQTPTEVTASKAPQATPPSSPKPTPASEEKHLNKALISITLSILALFIGGGTFNFFSSFQKPPPRQAPPVRAYNVSTFRVERESFREVIMAFGTARADRQVMISAEVAGLVSETHPELKVGTSMAGPQAVGGDLKNKSRIKPGDQLLRIAGETYQRRIEGLEQQVAQLRVQLSQLDIEKANDDRLLETQEANLKTSQEELQSKQNSLAAGAGNRSQVRAAELQTRQYEEQIVRLKNNLGLYDSRRKTLETQIAARQADLKTAQLDLDRTVVTPPFDGVLSKVNVELGQYIRPGDPLIELTDLNQIEVPIALTQSQFARIKPLLEAGETPEVSLAENESGPPRWTGRLVRSAPVADETTRTVDVFIEVENAKQTSPLLPGTFVHARIEGPTVPDQVVIPRDVIIQGQVYVARENDADEPPESESGTPYLVAQPVSVQIERTLQGVALLDESALADGDHVIMTNLDVIHDGALVTKQKTVTIPEELKRQRTPALRLLK